MKLKNYLHNRNFLSGVNIWHKNVYFDIRTKFLLKFIILMISIPAFAKNNEDVLIIGKDCQHRLKTDTDFLYPPVKN